MQVDDRYYNAVTSNGSSNLMDPEPPVMLVKSGAFKVRLMECRHSLIVLEALLWKRCRILRLFARQVPWLAVQGTKCVTACQNYFPKTLSCSTHAETVVTQKTSAALWSAQRIVYSGVALHFLGKDSALAGRYHRFVKAEFRGSLGRKPPLKRSVTHQYCFLTET